MANALTKAALETDAFFAAIHARHDRDAAAFRHYSKFMPSPAVTIQTGRMLMGSANVLSVLDPEWAEWWQREGRPLADLQGRPVLRPLEQWRDDDAWSRFAWDGSTVAARTPAPDFTS